jgi:hypothetical protein
MNALRIDFSGGLALGSCPPGRAPRCPSIAVSQVLLTAGSGISCLCSFCLFGPVSCGTIWLTLLTCITCMERARLVKGNDDDDDIHPEVLFV